MKCLTALGLLRILETARYEIYAYPCCTIFD